MDQSATDLSVKNTGTGQPSSDNLMALTYTNALSRLESSQLLYLLGTKWQGFNTALKSLHITIQLSQCIWFQFSYFFYLLWDSHMYYVSFIVTFCSVRTYDKLITLKKALKLILKTNIKNNKFNNLMFLFNKINTFLLLISSYHL